MADIKEYVKQINQASTGAEVRTTIVDALNALNNGSENALKLDGKPANEYLTKEQIREYTDFDEEPTEGSVKAVRSGGLYDYLSKANELLTNIIGE